MATVCLVCSDRQRALALKLATPRLRFEARANVEASGEIARRRGGVCEVMNELVHALERGEFCVCASFLHPMVISMLEDVIPR